ncbi:hypothetical protein ACFLZC_02305 [Patescibacteria group bacterium]
MDEFIPEILKTAKERLEKLEIKVVEETESPLVGTKGKNREFLFYIKPNFE